MSYRDPEKKKAYDRARYLENRGAVALRGAEYYLKNSASIKRRVSVWQKSNKARLNARHRAWSLKSKEKVRARHRDYARRNYKKILDKTRRYRHAFPDKVINFHSYVRSLIYKQTGLKRSMVPESIVELKHSTLKAKRLCKKLKLSRS